MKKFHIIIIILVLFVKNQSKPAYLTLISNANENSFIEFQIDNIEQKNKINNLQSKITEEKDLTKIKSTSFDNNERKYLTSKLISYPNDDFQFLFNDKIFLRYNYSINALKSDFNLNVVGDLELDSAQDQFIFEQTPVWKLYRHEDFQQDRGGWSRDSVSNCKSNENLFLGGYCNFAGEEIFKTYDKLPKHSKLMIQFSFHFIDEWTGEYAFAKMDNEFIWVRNHNWCDKIMPWFCKKYGINQCGNDFPDYLSNFVSVTFDNHSSNSIVLSFGSTLTKNACQASWGLDDLQIYFI